MIHQVEHYRAALANYEMIKQAINDLLSFHDGSPDTMTPEDHAHYRDLARQRDEALHEVRYLEQLLLDDNVQ